MKLFYTALFCALLLPQLPDSAVACGNAVLLTTDAARKRLATAEQALASGQYAAAMKLLEDVKVSGENIAGEVDAEDKNIARRMNRVRAVAYLRINYVSMGLGIIEQQIKETPDDPYLKTRLAEGLSLVRKNKEKNQKRALAILEELDKADLIPDAEGYVVLARLRAAAQDPAGSEKALESCRKRGKPELCVVEIAKK